MCKPVNILVMILLLSVIASCVSGKKEFGNYFNTHRYWGAMFVLKPDSSFDYSFQNNDNGRVIADSSYGRYSMTGDTIHLYYFSGSITGNPDNADRPKRLFWQGNRLYYIAEGTGQVIRDKDYSMRWSKEKAVNLYGLDTK
jgi:hypothetical protein